jgi:hypothetical protein
MYTVYNSDNDNPWNRRVLDILDLNYILHVILQTLQVFVQPVIEALINIDRQIWNREYHTTILYSPSLIVTFYSEIWPCRGGNTFFFNFCKAFVLNWFRFTLFKYGIFKDPWEYFCYFIRLNVMHYDIINFSCVFLYSTVSYTMIVWTELSFRHTSYWGYDAMLLLGWSHRCKNSTVIMTIWLTVTKYPSNDNGSFPFWPRFFLSSITGKTCTGPALPFRSTRIHPGFWWVSCCSSFSFLCYVLLFYFVLFVFVLCARTYNRPPTTTLITLLEIRLKTHPPHTMLFKIPVYEIWTVSYMTAIVLKFWILCVSGAFLLNCRL